MRLPCSMSPALAGPLAAVALATLCPIAGRAADGPFRLEAGAFAGYDSNPLRLSRGGSGAAFSELRLDGSADLDVSPSAGFLLQFLGRARRHQGAAQGADTQALDVRAGFDWRPRGAAARPLALSVGALYRLRRSTFLDPATGGDYILVADPTTTPATTLNLARRLDADGAGGYLTLFWQTGRRLQLLLDSEVRRDDHVEDYRESALVSSLDARRVWVQPGAVITLHNLARLHVGVGVSRVDYDQRPALDATGIEVAGTRASYDFLTYRLALDILPAPLWDVRFGLQHAVRDDTFAGYYSSRERSAWMSVRRPVGRAHQWQAVLSLGDLDYQHATVSGEPDGEARSSEVLLLAGRYQLRLASAWTLFVEGGSQRTDNPDPVYAFDRTWSLAGITFRH